MTQEERLFTQAAFALREVRRKCGLPEPKSYPFSLKELVKDLQEIESEIQKEKGKTIPDEIREETEEAMVEIYLGEHATHEEVFAYRCGVEAAVLANQTSQEKRRMGLATLSKMKFTRAMAKEAAEKEARFHRAIAEIRAFDWGEEAAKNKRRRMRDRAQYLEDKWCCIEYTSPGCIPISIEGHITKVYDYFLMIEGEAVPLECILSIQDADEYRNAKLREFWGIRMEQRKAKRQKAIDEVRAFSEAREEAERTRKAAETFWREYAITLVGRQIKVVWDGVLERNAVAGYLHQVSDRWLIIGLGRQKIYLDDIQQIEIML